MENNLPPLSSSQKGFLVPRSDGQLVWVSEENVHDFLNELLHVKKLEKFHKEVIISKKKEISELRTQVSKLKKAQKRSAKRFFEKYIKPLKTPKDPGPGMYEAKIKNLSMGGHKPGYSVYFKGKHLTLEFPVFRFYANSYKQALNFLHHRRSLEYVKFANPRYSDGKTTG